MIILPVPLEFYSIDDEKELEVVDEIVETFSQIFKIPQENIYEKEFGKGNYRYVYELEEGITLKICGPFNSRGMHTNSLEMKGEGCREFERRNGKEKWYLFLLTMSAQFDAQCTRIDLTIDDYDGNIVSFDWLKDKLEREMYTSAFKKIFSIYGNKYDGYSITFGQRKLCEHKGVEILEAEVCPDHIHMLVRIPPKINVSGFMGYR